MSKHKADKRPKRAERRQQRIEQAKIQPQPQPVVEPFVQQLKQLLKTKGKVVPNSVTTTTQMLQWLHENNIRLIRTRTTPQPRLNGKTLPVLS